METPTMFHKLPCELNSYLTNFVPPSDIAVNVFIDPTDQDNEPTDPVLNIEIKIHRHKTILLVKPDKYVYLPVYIRNMTRKFVEDDSDIVRKVDRDGDVNHTWSTCGTGGITMINEYDLSPCDEAYLYDKLVEECSKCVPELKELFARDIANYLKICERDKIVDEYCYSEDMREKILLEIARLNLVDVYESFCKKQTRPASAHAFAFMCWHDDLSHIFGPVWDARLALKDELNKKLKIV